MFAISASSLPSVRCYADAKRVADRAPLNHSINPRNKRDTSKTVWVDGERITFKFHRSALVIYESPTCLKINPWGSRSSVIFVNELVPRSIWMTQHSGVVRVNDMQDLGNGIRFNLVGGEWVVDPSTVRGEHQVVLDRSVKCPARAEFSRFLRYKAARERLAPCAVNHSGRISRYLSPVVQDIWFGKSGEGQPMESIYEQVKGYPTLALQRAFNVACGAVKRVPIPLGSIPKKSVYDAWI